MFQKISSSPTLTVIKCNWIPESFRSSSGADHYVAMPPSYSIDIKCNWLRRDSRCYLVLEQFQRDSSAVGRGWLSQRGRGRGGGGGGGGYADEGQFQGKYPKTITLEPERKCVESSADPEQFPVRKAESLPVQLHRRMQLPHSATH